MTQTELLRDNVKIARRVIGDNIRKRREALNITQRELAERLGMMNHHDRKAISQWECGVTGMPLGRLMDIAEALDCKLITLVEGLDG